MEKLTHTIDVSKLRSQTLELHGGVYSIETGEVWMCGFASDNVRSLLESANRVRRKPSWA
jgi:carbonic anhydrase